MSHLYAVGCCKSCWHAPKRIATTWPQGQEERAGCSPALGHGLPAWCWSVSVGQDEARSCSLPGQDVFTCGFVGALHGALFCASAVLNRNLHLDVLRLRKRTQAPTNNYKKRD